MFVALDTETALISDANPTPDLACIQLATENEQQIIHQSEAERWVTGLLRDPNVHLVGAEIAYDLAVLANEYSHLMPLIFAAYEADRIQDVAINAKLEDIHRGLYPRGYGLDDLAARYVRRVVSKDNPWRFRFGELIEHPIAFWPKAALDYALEDARSTFDIWIEQGRRGLAKDRFRQARASWWLRLTSNKGLKTDPTAVDRFEAELTTKADACAALLLENGLARQEKKGLVRDTKAAKARMQEVWTGELPRSPKGGISLSGEFLEDSRDPLLIAYADYSSTLKKLRTDIPLLRRGAVNRIHTHFEVCQETGRTGSSGPNIQNFDRKSGIRECFVPEPGYVYAMADYGKGELCTWAQVCLWLFGKSRMAEVLNAGGDPHATVARTIAGADYTDDHRQVGKVVDFGCPGGMGVKRLANYAWKAYDVKLTIEQAMFLREMWRNTWPEGRLYHNYISELFPHEAARVTMKQYVSDRLRGGCGYTQACNTLFQGLLADAGKHAGFYVAKACYVDSSSPLYGGYIVNFPHDEFIVEAPEDRAPWAAEELARLMHEKAADFVPDVTPVAEPLLSTRWSKKAKPKRDDRGLLIPWQKV